MQTTVTEAAGYSGAGMADVGSYRELSKTAVVSVVFLVLGLTALWHPVFLVMPLLGVFFAVLALLGIRRYPEELVGRPIALAGLVGCGCLVAGSIGMHSWIYATEVPEGYQRISFSDFRPNPRKSLPWSEKVEALDGKKIFVKGYIRTSKRKYNLKNFILVGDFGECCFGGSPKITDVVAVSILGDKTANYSWSVRRVTGTFRLNRQPLQLGDDEVPQVYYTIEADDVR